MFVWSVVSYCKRCGACKSADAFPYLDGLLAGYAEFTEYDGMLKDSLLPLCRRVRAAWRSRGLAATLVGSCTHQHWTPASNIDLVADDTPAHRAVLAAHGARPLGGLGGKGGLGNGVQGIVFEDTAWERPVHIYLGDATERAGGRLSQECRFLMSYLKAKHPHLTFTVLPKHPRTRPPLTPTTPPHTPTTPPPTPTIPPTPMQSST